MSTGYQGSVMYGLESTAGVPVTPTNGVPLIDEDVDDNVDIIKSKAFIAGKRAMTSQQHALGNIVVGGPVQHELYTVGLEDLFTQLHGGSPTKTSLGGGLWQRVWSWADLTDVTTTMQIGRPSVGAGVLPMTVAGMKIQEAEIAVAVGEIATIGLDTIGMTMSRYRTVSDGVTTNGSKNITSSTAAFSADDVGKPISGTGIPVGATVASVQSATAAKLSANATATGTGVAFVFGKALAAVSYPSGQHAFTFADGSLTMGGVDPGVVKSASLKFSNGLDADRRGLGSRHIRQPLEGDTRVLVLTADIEFTDLTHYNRFTAGAEVAAVLAFDTLASSTESLTFALNGYYSKSPKPAVKGKGIVRQTIEFEACATGADSTALTTTMINGTA